LLIILTEAFPTPLDLNRLLLLDHSILHSADLEGPESLYPPLPDRIGEFGVKRQLIEKGLQVLINCGLAEMQPSDEGIYFLPTESAPGFTDLLESPYARGLRERAQWAVLHLAIHDEASLRYQLRTVLSDWSEEFDSMAASQPPSTEP
jgi:hypothetical protein